MKMGVCRAMKLSSWWQATCRATKRITKQEYTTAAILDVIASEEGSADAVPAPPVAPPGAPRMATKSDAFGTIVQAINAQDSEGLIALCRPEFQKIINVEVVSTCSHRSRKAMEMCQRQRM